HLGRDANEIRALNFYGAAGDETPYGQKVDENHLARCWAEVKQAGEWERRRAEVDAFNQANPVLKRGLGLFPLKFGISFNIAHMNQAGALVHVYTDGSIRLNHGGTEMGQGLFIKVAQVVAEVFKVDIDRIRPSATSTAEVPNTSPTAASAGSGLNGAAARGRGNTRRPRPRPDRTSTAGRRGMRPTPSGSAWSLSPPNILVSPQTTSSLPTATCASPSPAATR